MSQSVGELFVNLGIKGSDKTISAIVSVGDGMKGLASMSLEAKAAIIATLYALEKITQASVNFGNKMSNLSIFTGENVEILQQWGKAAEKAGVSFEDGTGSIKAMQMAMAEFKAHGKLPDGMQYLAQHTPGGFQPTGASTLNDYIGFLQRSFHSSGIETGLANRIYGSMGISEGGIVAGRKLAFDPSNLAKMIIETSAQIGKLSTINEKEIENRQKWEKLANDLTAEHGGGLIVGISDLSDAIIFLIRELDKFLVFLEKKFGFGDAEINSQGGGKTFEGKLSNFLKLIPGHQGLDWWEKSNEDRMIEYRQMLFENSPLGTYRGNTINDNKIIHVHGVKDPEKVPAAIDKYNAKKQINGAYNSKSKLNKK